MCVCVKNSKIARKVLVFHLFLVPLQVRKQDKADLGVRIVVNHPLCLGLLLQDVVDPLDEEDEHKRSRLATQREIATEKVGGFWGGFLTCRLKLCC